MAERAPTLAELGAVIATNPPPESIAEALRASILETGATGAVPENGAVNAESAEPAAPPGSVPVNGTSRAQRRDQTGRFATESQEDTQETTETEKKVAASEDEPLEPPTEWKLEQQEHFRKLSPTDQRFVVERLGEHPGKLPEELAGVDQLVAPRREAWARLGQTPAAALSNLLAISDYASTEPDNFVAWFMQQHGIDPRRFVEQTGRANPVPIDDDPANNDPVVVALRGQIGALEKQVKQLGGTVADRQRAEVEAERATVAGELATFKNVKDERGQLQHPYFEDVRELMATFINNGRGKSQAKDLSEAYEMACRAHPEVHRKIAAAEAARRERETRKTDREKADRAKTAGASVSGSTGAPSPTGQTGDLRADLRAAFNARGLLGPAAV